MPRRFRIYRFKKIMLASSSGRKKIATILLFASLSLSFYFFPSATLAQPARELSARVIVADFLDARLDSLSVGQVRDALFSGSNSLSAYFRSVSYGKFSLSGNVYGKFTLPMNRTCEAASALQQAIKAASADPSFVKDNSTETIVLAPFDPNTCGWIGYYLGYNHWITVSSLAQDWQRVFAHELGHELGLQHASSYDCGGSALAASGCTADEYGDPYDSMGKAVPGLAEYNVVHREFLGWLDPANVRIAASGGRYNIEPLEGSGSGIKTLKIPRQNNEYIYLEYRRPLGFDYSLGTNNNAVYDGALAYVASENTGRSYLLAASPGSVLRVNQSITDPLTGTVITVTDVNPQGLVVNVALGGEKATRTSLNAASRDLPPGSVVLDGQTVYLINGRSKTPFATWQGFLDWGYSVKNLVKGDTSAYSLTGYIAEDVTSGRLPGRWVNHKGTVYYTGGGGLVPVPSWEIFLANGGTAQALANATAKDINLIKNWNLLALMTFGDARVEA